MRERRSKAVYGGGGEGIVRDGRSEWERTCGCGPGAARTNERAEIGTGGEDWPEEPTSSDGGSDVARSQSPAINSSIRPGFCRSQLDPLLVAGSVVFSTSPPPDMFNLATKTSAAKRSLQRLAAGMATAAEPIGATKVPMSLLESNAYINYQRIEDNLAVVRDRSVFPISSIFASFLIPLPGSSGHSPCPKRLSTVTLMTLITRTSSAAPATSSFALTYVPSSFLCFILLLVSHFRHSPPSAARCVPGCHRSGMFLDCQRSREKF